MTRLTRLTIFGAVLATILTGCDSCSKPKDNGAAGTSEAGGAADGAGEGAKALATEDIKVGSGTEALDGKKVYVLYEGRLTNGKVFDSRKDRSFPFDFVLGSGLMIAGWDQGIKGMREGGVRKLVIPPQLAYGSRGFGEAIPPNSTLEFEIELLKVE